MNCTKHITKYYCIFSLPRGAVSRDHPGSPRALVRGQAGAVAVHAHAGVWQKKQLVFHRGKKGEESFSVKFSHCIDGAAGVVLEGDNVEKGEDYKMRKKSMPCFHEWVLVVLLVNVLASLAPSHLIAP